MTSRPILMGLLICAHAASAQTAQQHLPKNDSGLRQAARADTFPEGECGARGRGGDPQLNTLKNRIDWPRNYEFLWVLPSAITEHKSPNFRGAERSDWTGKAADSVSAYEGLPLVVTGYLVDDDRYTTASGQGAEQQGPETTNCGAARGDGDIHLWLTPNAHQRYGKGIVAEITPRIISASNWGSEAELQKKLKYIARQGIQVEIYGWLMFDEEHYTQLKTTGCGAKFCPRRATLWELHPVMELTVSTANGFVPIAQWQIP